MASRGLVVERRRSATLPRSWPPGPRTAGPRRPAGAVARGAARRAAPDRARRRRRHRACSSAGRASRPARGSRRCRCSWTARRSPSWRTACRGWTSCGAAPDLDADAADPSYRSGFWGMARIGPRAGEAECAIGAARAPRRRCDERRRARPDPDPRVGRGVPAAWPRRRRTRRCVAICMATHEPPIALFRRQVDSIRAQTHPHWICVISDDCSSPASAGRRARRARRRRALRLLTLAAAARLLPQLRARARRSPRPRPSSSPWPTRTTTGTRTSSRRCSAAIGDARLVYSDARIVDTRRHPARRHVLEPATQQPRRPPLAARRERGHRRRLAVPPRPPRRRASLPARPVRPLPRPLDRALRPGAGRDPLRRPPALRLRPARARRARPRGGEPHAEPARARGERCAAIPASGSGSGGCTTSSTPAACCSWRPSCPCGAGAAWPRPSGARWTGSGRPTARSSRSPAWDCAARASSSGAPETLGAEWMLLHAFGWRRLLGASARDRPQRRLRLDAVPPPALDPRPAAAAPADPAVRAIADKIAPLRLAVRDDAPERLNLLIPTIDLRHFFGGYIAKLNLARRLAARGVRVRIVTVDPVGPLPRSWAAHLEAYSGLAGVFDEVEVAFGRESALEVGRTDAFVATTWWTAHIAHAALRELGRERFLYLIQEYEPFTFPMGSHAALAEASYRLPHVALFSTELLRTYFRRHGIGVYAAGVDQGDRRSAAFENAITDVVPPSAEELAGRATHAAARLRAAGGARRAEHVRARPAGARAGTGAGRLRARLEPARDRHRGRGTRRRPRRRRAPPARAAGRSGDVRGAAAGARRRAGADAHAASEPRPDRDGRRRTTRRSRARSTRRRRPPWRPSLRT